MRYKLTTAPSCTGCCACEEYLPGFVSKFGGEQQVGEAWAGKIDVLLAIDRAMRHCPASAITFEVME